MVSSYTPHERSMSVIFPGDEFPGNRFSLVKSENTELKDFIFKSSYAAYSPERDSFTIVFLNYEREEDSDPRPLNDGEVKVVIMVYNEDSLPVTPGEYRLKSEYDTGGSLFNIGILTNKGEFYASDVKSGEESKLVVSKADNKIFAGRVMAEDNEGMVVMGTFSVQTEKVMQE